MAIFTQTEQGRQVNFSDVKKDFENYVSKSLADKFESYENAQNEDIERNKNEILRLKSDVDDLMDRTSSQDDRIDILQDAIRDLDFYSKTNIKIMQKKIFQLEKFKRAYSILSFSTIAFLILIIIALTKNL